MPIDLVYLTSDRRNHYQHEELRYSLRSVGKHLSGVKGVHVIGVRPAWIQGVNFIEMNDSFIKNKDANIINKVIFACSQPEISNPFLFINDDHFLLQDCKARLFPYYCAERLVGNSPNGKYRERVNNTRSLLEAEGLPIKNYDVHTPIVIHRNHFLPVMAKYPWDTERGPGVVMKSLYGNNCPWIKGTIVRDRKFSHKRPGPVEDLEKLLQGSPCFSVTSRVSGVLWQLLGKLYPKPSRYEGGDE